jgi:glycosyltransferase involved in cell wall biosynthesis
LKVLFVITRADHGGAQVAVLDLVGHLPEGIHPVVAAGERGFLEDECVKMGVPFRLVPHLVQPMSPKNDLLALLEVWRLIRSEKPAVVHSHTSKAGLLARVAAWAAKTPSVFTAHTWSFDEGVPRLRQILGIPLERLVSRLGGKIITVSDANTEKALKRRIAPADRIVRIWNGAPDTVQLASPGTHTPMVMISVARMVQQKDFSTLLKAAAGLTGDWQLWLIGDGPNRAQLEAQTIELGLTGRVHFLGARRDVPELLAKADLFVLASRWEGLPISINEAMRAGLPVVASNVGGVSEQVTDGVSGFLTPATDVESLRGKLQTLIDSPELTKRMGAAGRKRFEDDFRIESAIARTVEVYQSVSR